MSAWDMQLIAAVIKEKGLQRASNRGIRADVLASAEGQMLYESLEDYASRPEHFGEVASLEMLESFHPGVTETLPKPTQSLDAIIEKVLNERLIRDIDKLMEEVNKLRLNNPKKAAALLAESSARLYESRKSEDEDITKDIGKAIRQDYAKILKGGGVGLWPWPWEPMTRTLGMVEPGTLNVLWGPPKRGKTWLAIKMVVDAFLNHSKRVLVYSPEMRKEQLQRRAAVVLAEISYDDYRKGLLTEEKVKALFEILDWIEAATTSNMTHERIIILNRDNVRGAKQMCAQMQAKIDVYKPDLLFVDSAYRDADSAKWTDITAVSRGVKDIGNRTGVPVIAVTQENIKQNAAMKGMKRRGDESVSHSQGWVEDMDLGVRVSNDNDGYIRMQWAGSREAKLSHGGIRCLFDPGSTFDFYDYKYEDPEPEASTPQHGGGGGNKSSLPLKKIMGQKRQEY